MVNDDYENYYWSMKKSSKLGWVKNGLEALRIRVCEEYWEDWVWGIGNEWLVEILSNSQDLWMLALYLGCYKFMWGGESLLKMYREDYRVKNII